MRVAELLSAGCHVRETLFETQISIGEEDLPICARDGIGLQRL